VAAGRVSRFSIFKKFKDRQWTSLFKISEKRGKEMPLHPESVSEHVESAEVP
jgi:hypothetical protein